MNRILVVSALSVALGGCGSASPFLPVREVDGQFAVFRDERAIVMVDAPQKIEVNVGADFAVICGDPSGPARPTGKTNEAHKPRWKQFECTKASWVEIVRQDPATPTASCTVDESASSEFVVCVDGCAGADDILRGRIEWSVRSGPCAVERVRERAAGDEAATPPPTVPSKAVELIWNGRTLTHGEQIVDGLDPITIVTSRVLGDAEVMTVEQAGSSIGVSCTAPSPAPGASPPSPSSASASGSSAASASATKGSPPVAAGPTVARCSGSSVILSVKKGPFLQDGAPTAVICATSQLGASANEKRCATVQFRARVDVSQKK